MTFFDAFIDMLTSRSFGSVWYWIVLSLGFVRASNVVLGIPFDLVLHAKHGDAQAQADLVDVARVQIMRILHIGRCEGALSLGLICFALAAVISAAVLYQAELCQALALLLLPWAAGVALDFRLCARIEALNPEVDALIRLLRRHRLVLMGLWLATLIIACLWGVLVNLRGPNW